MSGASVRARRAIGAAMFQLSGRPAPAPGTLTILMYHAVTATPIDE